MASRLPNPGSDDGTWGGILNDFLTQTHNTDGTLKDGIVTSSMLATGAVSATSLQDGTIVPAKLSADTPATGEILSYNGTGFEWITISAGSGSGESNTASNVGATGVGVFSQKVGVDLQFRKVNAASNRVSIVQGTDTVDIDVTEANLSLANIGGSLAQSKVTGLSTALSSKVDSSAVGAANGVASLDATGKVPSSQLPSGGGGSSLTFNFRSVTTSVTAADGDYILADASSSGITVTLPPAVANGTVHIKRVSSGSNSVQIVPQGSAAIDGSGVGSHVLGNQWDAIEFISDGTNWYRG